MDPWGRARLHALVCGSADSGRGSAAERGTAVRGARIRGSVWTRGAARGSRARSLHVVPRYQLLLTALSARVEQARRPSRRARAHSLQEIGTTVRRLVHHAGARMLMNPRL